MSVACSLEEVFRELQQSHKHNYSGRKLKDDASFRDLVSNPERIPTSREIPRKTIREAETELDPLRPVVLTDAMAQWRCHTEDIWSLDSLLKEFGETPFQIAGGRILLKDYVAYVSGSNADNPYYIFESNLWAEREKLQEHYTPPSLFSDDVLDVPVFKRPAPRYFLVGPYLSGTGIHQDPRSTSAWNALAFGHKRWCFFPPETSADVVKGRCAPDGDAPAVPCKAQASDDRDARLERDSGPKERGEVATGSETLYLKIDLKPYDDETDPS